MKKTICSAFAFLSIFISCAVFAQSGGMSSRPKFQAVDTKSLSFNGAEFTPTFGTFTVSVGSGGGCASQPDLTFTYFKFAGYYMVSAPTYSCTSNTSSHFLTFGVVGSAPTDLFPTSTGASTSAFGLCANGALNEACVLSFQNVFGTYSVKLVIATGSAITASGSKSLAGGGAGLFRAQ